MAHFRGLVQGNRGPATRLGSTELSVEAQSWEGKVVVNMWRQDQHDWVSIAFRPHGYSNRREQSLYYGRVDGHPDGHS